MPKERPCDGRAHDTANIVRGCIIVFKVAATRKGLIDFFSGEVFTVYVDCPISLAHSFNERLKLPTAPLGSSSLKCSF
jgi:hypothetical protein